MVVLVTGAVDGTTSRVVLDHASRHVTRKNGKAAVPINDNLHITFVDVIDSDCHSTCVVNETGGSGTLLIEAIKILAEIFENYG